MLRNFSDNVKQTPSIYPRVASGTTDINGDGVDCMNFQATQIMFLIGDSADTLSGTTYVECEVQESADNTTFTAVANADLSAYVAGTNVGTVAKIDAPNEDKVLVAVEYRGKKRYVRPVINLTGTHMNGIPVAALVSQSGGKVNPV